MSHDPVREALKRNPHPEYAQGLEQGLDIALSLFSAGQPVGMIRARLGRLAASVNPTPGGTSVQEKARRAKAKP